METFIFRENKDPKETFKISIDLDKSNKERQEIELTLSEKITSAFFTAFLASL